MEVTDNNGNLPGKTTGPDWSVDVEEKTGREKKKNKTRQGDRSFQRRTQKRRRYKGQNQHS